MTHREVLWTVTDPRGLVITLTEDVWQEHVLKHPEIDGYLEEAKLTAQAPDEIYRDPLSTERRQTGAVIYWYYRSRLTRGRYQGNYIAVVVKDVPEAGSHRGYVQSVLITGRVLRKLVLEWKARS